MSRWPVFSLVCVACSAPVAGVPTHRDPSAARVLDPGCPGSAYATVQDAIDAASAQDVVEVCAGTFAERLVVSGKALVLRSADGPADTVVDAGGVGRALTVTTASPVTVEGLTFRNGWSSTGAGGNVQCERSNLLLRDNVLEDGEARRGAGLGASLCTGRLEGNTFRDNRATDLGGGLYVEGTIDVLDNRFEANASDSDAGAAFVRDSFATIRGNTVIANTAEDDGGGLFVRRGAPWVDGNVFEDNVSGEEGGGMRVKTSQVTVTDNVFANNRADWRGGGMKMSHDESVLSGNTWTGNEAGSKGGAVLPTNSTLRRSRSLSGSA